MEGHSSALDPLGPEAQTRIDLPNWIANEWVSKGIMPLAAFEAEPQPST